MVLSQEQEEILENVLKMDKLQANKLYRACIFGYNAGDIQKMIVYTIYYGKKRRMKKGYQAELKIALGDVIAQIFLLIKLFNLDMKEIIDLGIGRLTEFPKYTEKYLVKE